MSDLCVSRCVMCIKHNSITGSTLPVMCPGIEMPCLAIEPDVLIPDIDMDILDEHMTDDGRFEIHGRVASQEFVQRMLTEYDDLERQGHRLPDVYF